jgi:starch phosphorylase
MAYLAIRGSGAVNGVSRLHGEVSRHLFAPLFPRWPQDEIPVGHVTNGVHMPTWDAVEADALYDLLEREVIPEFYSRDESGIPTAWRG